MHMKTPHLVFFALFFLVAARPFSAFGDEAEPRLPSHADAAVIFAKHTGFFDRYIAPEASLTECVTFLNETGIYFGLMEVVNGKDFALNDCARVMGQIELVLSGEADYVAGKVKLPKGIDSWEDFCIMNGVQYVEAYQAILQSLNQAGM